ncbi:MurR/RpiR family transcriptional regulator [Ammoniphilus sp. CFH 90114]|nr:MurR/RpiR family transcriptional regulator [Ammoniphilus sp. CFH 90114]
MNGGLVSLRAMLDELKPSERKVAQFILDHPHEVVKLSVQKLAELSEVSDATVIRLSRSLNMTGYQELKLRIAGDLTMGNMQEKYQEIGMDGSTSSIIHSVSSNNMQSIQDTISVLSPESVEEAAEALLQARKIDIYGVGASAVIAYDLRQKLHRINLWCESYSDFHAQLTSAVNLKEQDVVFGISYSGQTEDIIQSITEAKKQGAKVITLTKFGSNPVSDLADIKLFTSSVEKSIRTGAMASRIAQLNVIDIVFIAMASQRQEEVIPLLDKTRMAVSRTKRSLGDR